LDARDAIAAPSADRPTVRPSRSVPETHYPVLVAAKGACPPEDCGSAWGYANLKDILANPSHDEHQEMLEWLGLNDASEFDPAAVPTNEIDYELALSGASR
jgi:hypothetical protein